MTNKTAIDAFDEGEQSYGQYYFKDVSAIREALQANTSEWRDIDSAPKDGDIYATCDFGEGREVRALSKDLKDDNWYCDSGEFYVEKEYILFWQHNIIPTPPTEGGDDDGV